MYSAGATNGGEGDSGSASSGLFGAVVVEPAGSHWYRSQVTRSDIDQIVSYVSGSTGYPVVRLRAEPTACGVPILNMLDSTNEIIHTDVTAIITGSEANTGRKMIFSTRRPSPPNVNTYPNRNQPFREFVIIYHDEIGAVQAFPQFEIPSSSTHCTAGATPSRSIMGPAASAPRSSPTVSASGPCGIAPSASSRSSSSPPGRWATRPWSWTCRRTRLRRARRAQYSGPGSESRRRRRRAATEHALHAHRRQGDESFLPGRSVERLPQLPARPRELPRAPRRPQGAPHLPPARAPVAHTPDSDKSSYKDSQAIGPGAGTPTRSPTKGAATGTRPSGDSIFHCHFYPHFAQGMWSLWRVHDVLELARCWTERAARRPARAPCRTARSPPARRSRRSFPPRLTMAPFPEAIGRRSAPARW